MATTSMYKSCTHNRTSPTIIPDQSGSYKPPLPESKWHLICPHRSGPYGLTDREKFSSVDHRSRKIRNSDTVAEKQPSRARMLRKYVYNRHLESGKDVISLQRIDLVCRSIQSRCKPMILKETGDTYFPHRYDLSRCARSQRGIQQSWQPRNHRTRRFYEAHGRPDRTFDCWCLNCE